MNEVENFKALEEMKKLKEEIKMKLLLREYC